MYRACLLLMDIFHDEMVKVVLHMTFDVINYRCIPVFVTISTRVSAQDPEPLVEIEISFRVNDFCWVLENAYL